MTEPEYRHKVRSPAIHVEPTYRPPERSPQAARLRHTIDVAGGIIAFRKALGVTHQAVYSWLRKGHVPIKRAGAIEALYGVPVRDLVDPAITRALATSDIL